MDARDFVAGSSSPAASSHSSRTVARTARRCCMKYCDTTECPRRGYGPKGVHHDHCLSLGEEEAVLSGRGAKGVAVPPWKRREAGGVGGHSGPKRAPVTECISTRSSAASH